jgi:hypothetical protein
MCLFYEQYVVIFSTDNVNSYNNACFHFASFVMSAMIPVGSKLWRKPFKISKPEHSNQVVTGTVTLQYLGVF